MHKVKFAGKSDLRRRVALIAFVTGLVLLLVAMFIPVPAMCCDKGAGSDKTAVSSCEGNSSEAPSDCCEAGQGEGAPCEESGQCETGPPECEPGNDNGCCETGEGDQCQPDEGCPPGDNPCECHPEEEQPCHPPEEKHSGTTPGGGSGGSGGSGSSGTAPGGATTSGGTSSGIVLASAAGAAASQASPVDPGWGAILPFAQLIDPGVLPYTGLSSLLIMLGISLMLTGILFWQIPQTSYPET